jgi:hypothetical protein
MMQTHRKTNLEPSLHMRAENETKRRANRRPSRNQIQPQPQEKDQARTGKSLRFDGSKYEPRRPLHPDPKCERGKMGITNITQQDAKTNISLLLKQDYNKFMEVTIIPPLFDVLEIKIVYGTLFLI